MSGAEKQLVMVTIVSGFHEKAKKIQIKTQKRKAEVFTGFRIQNLWHIDTLPFFFVFQTKCIRAIKSQRLSVACLQKLYTVRSFLFK